MTFDRAVCYVLITTGFASAVGMAVVEPPQATLPAAVDYRADQIRFAAAGPDVKEFGIDEGAKLASWIDKEPRRLAVPAQKALALYESTENRAYLDTAVSLFNRLLARWDADPALMESTAKTDFFALEPLIDVYTNLKKRGLTKEPETGDTVQRFSRAFVWRAMGGHNQALARTLGAIRALQTFPDDPAAAEWRKYVDDNLNDLIAAGDLDENAGNYNAIGLRFFVLCCEAMGRTEELKTPQWRATFARYRDQLAPSGFMPEYGDDYFAPLHPVSESILWVYVLERAADLFGDDTFSASARRLYWGLSRAQGMAGPADLLALRPSEASGDPATLPGSHVSERLEPGAGKAIDKLILRPGGARAPFLLMDLYCRGYHAHENRRGSIGYFEAAGVPVFHGLTRQNPETEASNLFLIKPAADAFPFAKKYPPAGAWHTASFPTRSLAGTADQRNVGEVMLRSMLDRQPPGKPTRGVELFIDNLRLEGRAGARLIDSFDNKGKRYDTSPDHTEGAGSWLIRLKDGQLFCPITTYDVPFSINDYQTLKFDWKYSAEPDNGFRFIFRAPGIENGPVNSVGSDPLLVRASVNDTGGDAFATIELDEYQGFDNRLTRFIALTAEGYLVIRDQLTPGKSAKGTVGGPVWHLYGLSERGDDWFASNGEAIDWRASTRVGGVLPARSVVVRYGTSAGREISMQKSELDRVSPVSTFARQPLTPGEPLTFVTVVVPFDRSRSAASVAESIHIASDQSSVEFVGPAGLVTVSWSVSGPTVTR